MESNQIVDNYFFKIIYFLTILLIFLGKNIYSEESQSFIEFIRAENFSLNQIICADEVFIENKKFCVHRSKITLNSCGIQSDWPCMDDQGCLEIERLIKK